jgi:hypothetical protein
MSWYFSIVKDWRAVVGFYRDKGKTKPITKSVSKLNQKKVVVKSRGFKGVAPSTEVGRLARREYAVLKKYTKRIDIAGSIRRRKPDPTDIDFVIIPKSAEAKQAIYKHAENYKIRAQGSQLLSYWLLPRKRAQVDIYFAEPQTHGAMLLFATGPGEYNIALRAKAIAQGLKLNQYGVWKGNKCLGSKTERDVYDALLYPYKSPELRGLSDKEAKKRFGAEPGQRVLRELRVGKPRKTEEDLSVMSYSELLIVLKGRNRRGDTTGVGRFLMLSTKDSAKLENVRKR